MPDPKRRKEAAEWLQYAAEDLDSAELLLGAGRLRQALFSAQQAVEKALKAFLIWHGESYPLTHNLTFLRDLCGAFDSSLFEIIGPALALTDFAIRFRYPGTMLQQLGLEDAQQLVASARQVYHAIVGRLPGVAE